MCPSHPAATYHLLQVSRAGCRNNGTDHAEYEGTLLHCLVAPLLYLLLLIIRNLLPIFNFSSPFAKLLRNLSFSHDSDPKMKIQQFLLAEVILLNFLMFQVNFTLISSDDADEHWLNKLQTGEADGNSILLLLRYYL